ncbi:thioredoxin domain-containing protein [Thioalkalivibrio paradoxus]|uniref:Thioredoxin n=1 Tax=Thioalkalivibrio paradoxus ARh 1 TaxID=713585 RepID=W0DND1_9GAMM|nr:thioredoxin domain-containing protein [Thioalkalivibrio paradoxus]AHE98742.1 thioredoxin [Thioalkalivibrio paradoxus ARh 1]
MNRLARASSPYLQQHAENPVDWYPWGDEALHKARDEQRPILLSIGYSACHWCHVMAHESFENPGTARVMNARYVNIKVDREERPELDRIYQHAHMLLTRRPGGWPLTVILTPDQVPFFAGTYFPDRARHGLPAFLDVLERVADFLDEHPEQIAEQNAALQQALTRMYNPEGGTIPDAGLLDRARAALKSDFDPQHGGFGGAPKFPHPAMLEWLFWHAERHGDAEAGAMLERTLTAMARGGLFDQVGGGFCRYSVDAQWMIPHFEKMLYDNGPLLGLYAAAQGDARSRRVADQTVGWLLREMHDSSGAFHSSLDADSEGEEGRFYVWEREEVERLLEPEQWRLARRVWGLDRPPNFEGRWHLREAEEPDAAAAALDLAPDTAQALLQAARERLLEARERRERPHRDDKILGAWNALMISGLIRAGEALDEPGWLDHAETALQAVRRLLWRDGRLYASYREGADTPMPRACLDDHALLLAACLDLLRVRWRVEWLDWAVTLADGLLRDFADPAHGGFYYTAVDHEALIQRPKVYADDAIAAGNGVAAQALLQLGYLLVEPRYLDAVERTLTNAGPMMEESPLGHMSLLRALDLHRDPPPLVILRGPEAATARWQRAIRERLPPAWTFALPTNGQGLPPALAGKCGHPTAPDRVVAYLCRGTACAPPEYDLESLLAAL